MKRKMVESDAVTESYLEIRSIMTSDQIRSERIAALLLITAPGRILDHRPSRRTSPLRNGNER